MNRQEASLFFRLRVVPCSPVPPNKAMQTDRRFAAAADRQDVRPFVDRRREQTMTSRRGGTLFALSGVLCLLGVVPEAQRGDSPRVLQPRTSAASPALDFQFDAVQVGTAEYSEGPTGV